MPKREWDAESNGKLLHLFIPSKSATLVPEFAVEDLPLDRTATLVSVFAVKGLALGRTLIMMIILLSVKLPRKLTYFINVLTLKYCIQHNNITQIINWKSLLYHYILQ